MCVGALMRKIMAIAASVAVACGGLAAYEATATGGAERVWESITGPLGVESGDGDSEREITVSNPTTTISAGRYDASTVATTGGKLLKHVAPTHPTKSQRDKVRPEAPKVKSAVQATGSTDAAVQTAVTGKAPTVGTGFVGMTHDSNGCGWPPDTSGDVGGATGLYYVQAVNCSVAIYHTGAGTTAAGTVAGGPWTIDDFMKSAMGASSTCASNNQGDPVVTYDVAAGRWIVMDFNWSSSSGPYYFCIAVSNTDNPTGAWHGYAYETTLGTFAATGNLMPDYPKMSVTPNAVAITANMFGSTYSGAGVYLLDRTSLYCNPGGATTCSLKSFRWQLGTAYFSLLPGNVRFPVASGAASKVGAFLASDYGVSSSVRVWTIDKPVWTGTTAPAFNGPVSVSVPSFSKAGMGIPQPGSGAMKLDSLGDRLMHWAQVADSATTATILLSRTVTAGNGGKYAAIRWEELTWTASSGTFAAGKGTTYYPNSDSTFRWMPSAAFNNKGEIAVGYSRSSGSVYPEIRVAGATATSAGSAAPTTDVAETVVRTGSGSQSGYNRWGDYSSMSADPTGCKFWYTTEYYTGGVNRNWRTWIQPFTLTSCP